MNLHLLLKKHPGTIRGTGAMQVVVQVEFVVFPSIEPLDPMRHVGASSAICKMKSGERVNSSGNARESVQMQGSPDVPLAHGLSPAVHQQDTTPHGPSAASRSTEQRRHGSQSMRKIGQRARHIRLSRSG